LISWLLGCVMVYTMLACIGALCFGDIPPRDLRRRGGGLCASHFSLHAQAERVARGLKWKQVQRLSPHPAAGDEFTQSWRVLGWTLDAFDFLSLFFSSIRSRSNLASPRRHRSNYNGDSRHASPGRVAVRSFGGSFRAPHPLMANVIYFSIIELLCGFAPSFRCF